MCCGEGDRHGERAPGAQVPSLGLTRQRSHRLGSRCSRMKGRKVSLRVQHPQGARGLDRSSAYSANPVLHDATGLEMSWLEDMDLVFVGRPLHGRQGLN